MYVGIHNTRTASTIIQNLKYSPMMLSTSTNDHSSPTYLFGIGQSIHIMDLQPTGQSTNHKISPALYSPSHSNSAAQNRIDVAPSPLVPGYGWPCTDLGSRLRYRGGLEDLALGLCQSRKDCLALLASDFQSIYRGVLTHTPFDRLSPL